jgi:alpha-1,3-rhamnosyl/mannosyltransferase
MRIGVDATCWFNRRGYGRFARALLTATLELDRENRYTFFTDSDSAEFPLPAGVEVVRVPTDVPTVKAASADGRRSIKDMGALSQAMSEARLDLVFFPSVYSFVPLVTTTPVLVTIHDVIPELFPELVFPTRKSKFFWDIKLKLACLQSRLILTVSEYSRRRLAEKLRINPAHIRVVPEAGDPAFRPLPGVESGAWRARHLVPSGRFLAYVGGFSPHKNLSGLLSVFAEIAAQPQFADVHLLLVGDYQGDAFYSCYQQLRAQVRGLKLDGRVFFPGYMPDDDLVTLYNLAEAVVLPSFCEGFGLPAVEAAACGAPSVVTTESPLVEVLGAGTIGVAPEDRAGWRAALETVLSEPGRREAMRAAALAAASRLTWEKAASELLAIFDEVLCARAAAH